MRVDLNADLGESFGVYTLGEDATVMPHITSVNVACGFHAGDPGVMRATVRLAQQHEVAVGAHPGFPDLVGFGRRDLHATPQEVEDLVVYQIGALAAIAHAQGVRLQHVKAHGTLYSMAARDAAYATAIARGVAGVDRSLVVFGPPHSELARACDRHGLRAVSEAFPDRAYRADGTLVPRSEEGAVIANRDVVVDRAVRMGRDRSVVAVDGSVVELDVETICIHGDAPGAADLAARIRGALRDAGVRVQAVAAP